MESSELRTAFIALYGREPRIFRAPGRVNLIGEHTDYNDGFVMPCALGFATTVAIASRDDRRLRVTSREFEGEFDFDLDTRDFGDAPQWAKYVGGMAVILDRRGMPINGADILISSDVPVGAGLSSSAALEIATGLALTKISGLDLDRWLIARSGQAAENEFAGVRSGIMDQFASSFGVAGHALFLDCRSYEWSPIPLGDARILICNTKSKHELADGEYNKRRADCEQAARLLGAESLRDVAFERLQSGVKKLTDGLFRRARHVVTENERVLAAVEALRSGELAAFGRLMNESHDSLRDDYDVSCRELDVMVAAARRQKGVLGARMTGGGFGGCTVNLLASDAPADSGEKIAREYESETGIRPEIYVADASDGARELEF